MANIFGDKETLTAKDIDVAALKLKVQGLENTLEVIRKDLYGETVRLPAAGGYSYLPGVVSKLQALESRRRKK